jgi:hypothetical protein
MYAFDHALHSGRFVAAETLDQSGIGKVAIEAPGPEEDGTPTRVTPTLPTFVQASQTFPLCVPVDTNNQGAQGAAGCLRQQC